VRDDRGVVVSVEDDGPGLDPELRERIFEPFFTTKHTGTGLGLAIVKRLADINRAEISVASRKGQGTRFTLTLPARRASATAVAARGAGTPPDGTVSSPSTRATPPAPSAPARS